ncbi:MAG: hypothetical protein MJE66_09490 [Proteobacteria bacterium]|nr:hypothetical protein [Pseudomonadota bacterium]
MDPFSQFSDMKPVDRAPSLGGINGIGFRLYGSRDEDAATSSYVATYFFTFVFLPVLALAAYRVARTTEGEYILGKVPLSGLAKGWNALVVLSLFAAVGGGSWNAYTGSPEYAARQALHQAVEAEEEGEVGLAAAGYASVVEGGTNYGVEAKERLGDLLDPARLRAAQPQQAAGVVAHAFRVRTLHPRFAPALVAEAWSLLEDLKRDQPAAAKRILDALAPHEPDKEKVATLSLSLLHRIVEIDPENVPAAVELALHYEAKGDFERSQEILEPRAERLGDTEGARLLGQLYAHQGRVDESHALLLPYTQKRLEAFHQAEAAYDQAIEALWDGMIRELEAGRAPAEFYAKYDRSTEVEQAQMVDEYFAVKRDKSALIQQRLEAYRRAGEIVPVALDLGMVMVQRAPSITDPEARRHELEAAEKIFLAIQGAASESDQYRLYLGQVYYWLGRGEEGHALFDELLVARKRSPKALYEVAVALREVGAKSESRALVEEAYGATVDQEMRYGFAQYLSVLATDREDRIAWLEKSDPKAPDVQAELAEQRGHEAMRLNQRQAAARHYRESIDLRNKLHPDAPTLNNTALVYFALYRATGERPHFREGLQKMEAALELRPGNSILLYNLAEQLIVDASFDVIGKSLDLRRLRMEGSVDLLHFLHYDGVQQAALAAKLRAHPSMKKALSHLGKVMVLAPKSGSAYSAARGVHGFTRSQDEMADLWQRLQGVELDLNDDLTGYRAQTSGERAAYQKESLEKRIESQREKLAQLPAKAVRTRAVAEGSLVMAELGLYELGEPVNLQQVVKRAGASFRRAPSHAMANVYEEALAWAVVAEWASRSSHVKRLAADYTRTMMATTMLAVALAENPEERTWALSLPAAKQLVALQKDVAVRYPSRQRGTAWAILRHADPELAAELAKRSRNDAVYPLLKQVDLVLWPYRTSVAYAEYWRRLQSGEARHGLAALQAAQAMGTKLVIPKG